MTVQPVKTVRLKATMTVEYDAPVIDYRLDDVHDQVDPTPAEMAALDLREIQSGDMTIVDLITRSADVTVNVEPVTS